MLVFTTYSAFSGRLELLSYDFFLQWNIFNSFSPPSTTNIWHYSSMTICFVLNIHYSVNLALTAVLYLYYNNRDYHYRKSKKNHFSSKSDICFDDKVMNLLPNVVLILLSIWTSYLKIIFHEIANIWVKNIIYAHF